MGTDALGYTIAILVVGVSFIAVRYRNMLLTLGAAIMWAVLLAFILANTTAGTNWQSMFILGIVAFMCSFALISFLGRSRGDRSFTENIGGLVSREKEAKSPIMSQRGLMDLNNDEYRAVIRARLRRRRR